MFGAYFLNITVGGNTFDVLLDTGSSNLVLPSLPDSSSVIECGTSDCNNCIPSNARTARASEYTCSFGPPICNTDNSCAFQISYGGGALQSNGTLYSDKVCISPDLCTSSIFGLSADPPSSGGLIGFASDYNSCNPTCVSTPFENLVQAGLTNNTFGLCLNATNGGLLDIGEIVSTRYSGEISYVPMEVDRWYNLNILDIIIGNTSIGVNPIAYKTTNDVIGSFVDSGTTLLICNSLIYSEIQSSFQNEQFCHLPGLCGEDSFFNNQCLEASKIGDLSEYPDVTIAIAGYNYNVSYFPIPATSYLIELNGYICFGIEETTSVGIVLGDVFMENYYIVFDRSKLQVGFANVADCTV